MWTCTKDLKDSSNIVFNSLVETEQRLTIYSSRMLRKTAFCQINEKHFETSNVSTFILEKCRLAWNKAVTIMFLKPPFLSFSVHAWPRNMSVRTTGVINTVDGPDAWYFWSVDKIRELRYTKPNPPPKKRNTKYLLLGVSTVLSKATMLWWPFFLQPVWLEN